MSESYQKLLMRNGRIEDWFIGTESQVIRHAKKMLKLGYVVVSICTGGKVTLTCR